MLNSVHLPEHLLHHPLQRHVEACVHAAAAGHGTMVVVGGLPAIPWSPSHKAFLTDVTSPP